MFGIAFSAYFLSCLCYSSGPVCGLYSPLFFFSISFGLWWSHWATQSLESRTELQNVFSSWSTNRIFALKSGGKWMYYESKELRNELLFFSWCCASRAHRIISGLSNLSILTLADVLSVSRGFHNQWAEAPLPCMRPRILRQVLLPQTTGTWAGVEGRACACVWQMLCR